MTSPSILRDRARRLRRDQTEAEGKLWARLRHRQVGGAKFRRQHFIHPFIVDFCCPDQWLIIELDGGQHAVHAAADQRRTAILTMQGYRVLRFWNHEVLTNLEGVLEWIVTVLSDPHPGPLPSRAREKRSDPHPGPLPSREREKKGLHGRGESRAEARGTKRADG